MIWSGADLTWGRFDLLPIEDASDLLNLWSQPYTSIEIIEFKRANASTKFFSEFTT
jgi:hypothetical protein